MKAVEALHQSRFKPMLLEDSAKLPELLKEARRTGKIRAKREEAE